MERELYVSGFGSWRVLEFVHVLEHAVQTLTRIRTGGSPIMPTSVREKDKLQCKQTIYRYTCQVKQLYLFLHKDLLYACMRSIKYNILVFNWCKNCRPRLARFSVIDVTKFVTKLFYLPDLSGYIPKSTFFHLFPILTHVFIIAAPLNNQ